MATKPIVGGYRWNQLLSQAKKANRRSRGLVQQILDERPGPALAAVYIANLALQNGIIEEALNELEQIGRGETTGRAGAPDPGEPRGEPDSPTPQS